MTNANYPKDCGCVGTCGHGVEGSQGTVVMNPDTIGDIVGDVIIKNGGLETNYIYKDDFSQGMMGLLFDMELKTYDDGQSRMVYRLKNGLGNKNKLKQVQISKRNNTCVVVWYEGTALTESTGLVADADEGDTTIELVDAMAIGGISIPMELVIKDDVNMVRKPVTITAIDAGNPNLLTLKDPLDTKISATSCITRGHYNPAAGCTNSYSNTVSLHSNDKEYFSYFTRIIYTLEYNDKCLINQTFLGDLLKGDAGSKETSAYRILQTSFATQIDSAMRDFVRSAFFHDNTPSDNLEYSKTYGLFPKMEELHAAGIRQFFDMSTCCDETKCPAENAEKIINEFYKILESRTQLSIYSQNRRVVVLVNQEQVQALTKLRKYFEMNTGEIRYIEQSQASENDVISSRRKMFKVEHMGYEVVFIYEKLLDEVPGEFALIMPENTMGIFTYKNSYVEADSNGVKIVADTSTLVAGDTLKFNMAKDIRSNNAVDRCSKFDMWLDYAIVWLFVDKCAYAGLWKMALCEEEEVCQDCKTLSATPFA